jgi:hypothetical protein
MWDIHRKIAAAAGECRHIITGKRLTPRDPGIFAAAARDDVGATAHLRLRLVESRVSKVDLGIGT